MAGSDDQFDDGENADQSDAEFERLQQELFARIEAFMDDEDVGEAYMVDLLVDVAIRLRMTAYGMEVEKPSVGGLKLDLDRLRQDVDEIVRDAKKGAEEYIALVKDVRAQQAREADEGETE